MEINGRRIGEGEPTYIIAEAGLAHLGSLDIAMQMADVAKAAGADAFKTQAFDPCLLYPEGPWRHRLKPRALTAEELGALKAHCDRIGLTFILTPHDDWGLEIVTAFKLPAVKIGSGERGNLPFIQRIGALNRPTIISTGMHHVTDIFQAVNALGHRNFSVLHCVTAYPTDPKDANLNRIKTLADRWEIVGYSDHTAIASIGSHAVAAGAKIVELHFKPPVEVDSSNDAKASFSYLGLMNEITGIRNIETLLGSGTLDPAPEALAQDWALKDPATNRRTFAG
jgi:N,N'-diacetyllegionaminate synthase